MCHDDLNQPVCEDKEFAADSFGEAPLDSDLSKMTPVLPVAKKSIWLRAFYVLSFVLIVFFGISRISSRNRSGGNRDRLAVEHSVPLLVDAGQPDVSSNAEEEVPQRDAIWNQLKAAKSHWDNKEYERVVEICDEILIEHPTHDRTIYVRAFANAKLGNSRLAVQDHAQLQKLNSDLAKEGSDDLEKAYLIVAQQCCLDAKVMMDSGQIQKANRLLSQCVLLCDSSAHFVSSNKDLATLAADAKSWLSTCELASADDTGAIASSLKFRQWHDRSGRHTVHARLLRVDDKATLERVDGTRAAIRLDQLSPLDQAWLEELNKLKSQVGAILE